MRPFKQVKVKTFYTPAIEDASAPGDITIAARVPENIVHLMDTYDSMEFRSLLIKMLAGRFVKENYHRLMNGINFESLEADVLDLVKQKFADMLKVEPKKEEKIYVRMREIASESLRTEFVR